MCQTHRQKFTCRRFNFPAIGLFPAYTGTSYAQQKGYRNQQNISENFCKTFSGECSEYLHSKTCANCRQISQDSRIIKVKLKKRRLTRFVVIVFLASRRGREKIFSWKPQLEKENIAKILKAFFSFRKQQCRMSRKKTLSRQTSQPYTRCPSIWLRTKSS